MVKSLRVFGHTMKWLVLLTLLSLMALMAWLHKDRSLEFAKPWIVNAVNDPEAPFTISIGDVSLNWRDLASLGKMRITNVQVSMRNGDSFAQFPEIYATIDPFGFLPKRRLLHTVMLRSPKLSVARNAEGLIEFGIEDSTTRMPLSELADFMKSDSAKENNVERTLPRLPFRDFIIDDATFTFTDAVSGTTLVSNPFTFSIKRRRGTYDAMLTAPFTVDDKPVMLTGKLQALPDTKEHVLALKLSQFPSKLICMFATCGEGIAAEGPVDGTVAIGISDKDMSVNAFHINLATTKAEISVPKVFAEPLKLVGPSVLTFEGNWAKKHIALTQAKLALEDTTITATGQANEKEDGWYVVGDGACTQLNIQKVYKYWPLTMAPDSRTWITSKLKSGYAAKGTIKINFKPEDFKADFFPDASVDAVADARDITFEYLPGFPLVEKMNGIAHFTGTTVRVEGGGGTMLSGTKINRAVLWCPKLHEPKNPMETELELAAPAADVVSILALKHFPFDDKFQLNAKTIQGTVDASMKLKFDAFSENKNTDPNEINLEGVSYDIKATMHNVAQDTLYGSYNAKSVNGELKANNAGLKFDGSLQLGESAINDVNLSQDSGKPLTLNVAGRTGKEAKPLNDFNLVYNSAANPPGIKLRGKRIDASTSYGSGGSGESVLANFPAMKLDIDIDELVIAPAAPITQVVGTLNCSAARCESANFGAKAGKSTLTGTIASTSGVRQLTIKGNDAGSLLKAFDVSDRMTRGRLDIKGTYDDSKTPPQLNGRLLITDFTLQNSQILGRILSIGSLTGLANALTGSGIEFEKLAADFTSREGLFTVNKGVANGNAIGITVNGTVNTNRTKFDLKGVVAPAYALNSFIGKIPIIGALAGGEEGLIAFNYSVGGTFADPDVGVNPLSGLTPGFLRGIFGVFEHGAEGAETPEAEPPSPEQKLPAIPAQPVSGAHP